MAWYVSLYSWPMGARGVGLFIMRLWLGVLYFFFPLIVLIVGGEEVRSMNVGKVGAPFKYPHIFIASLKVISSWG